MSKWEHIKFEGKHADEKVLHFAHPAKVQTIFEISKLVFALLVVELIIFSIWQINIISLWVITSIMGAVWLIGLLSIFYKSYRTKNNFLYITSKRIIFHGINGLFWDHVRKITLDNIRNVDYRTESLLGRIFGYGTLMVQTSNDTGWDNHIWHINDAKLLTHYIDKIISLSLEERINFNEFDASYFKNWKNWESE